MLTIRLLTSSLLFAFCTLALAQDSNDLQNSIELTGKIESAANSNYELAYCIANSAMLMGVTAYTETEDEATESAYVEGSYAYAYYVDNYDLEAGTVSFKFLFEIRDGIINYKFYDFEHNGNNTDFESIGLFPDKWNEKIGKVFTEEQFLEIKKDVFANYANALRLIIKNCVND